MSIHQFEPEIAEQVGIAAAVIYQNIKFWCEKNQANEKNIHDGRAWTYNSAQAFSELFPYLSPKQIRSALTKLQEAEFIASGNFNKDTRDRTKWYSDLRSPICPNGKMEIPKREDTFSHEVTPLPDIKPDNKQSISLESGFDEFYEAYGKKVDRKQALGVWTRKKLHSLQEQIIQAATEYARQREVNYRKSPFRWLRDENWTDHQVASKPDATSSQTDRMKLYAEHGVWPAAWGAMPKEAKAMETANA